MSDVVLTGSTGSTRASFIAVGEEEDNSDADTVRMSTPDFERWASENCRINSQNLFLTEFTPASTFLTYRNCQQFEHARNVQSSPPAARGEPTMVGDSKKVCRSDACPSWLLFTEIICQYKQIDHRGQHEILAYKHPGQAQNAERVTGQFSETTINASKVERENAVMRLVDSTPKDVVCVLLWMTLFGTVDYGIEYGLGAMENATYDWFSATPFSTLE